MFVAEKLLLLLVISLTTEYTLNVMIAISGTADFNIEWISHYVLLSSWPTTIKTSENIIQR